MAWPWKQGRLSLLAVAGLGFLGYKALHSRRKAHRQEQARPGVVHGTQRMTTRSTPTPAGKRTKAPFLGGLSITELVRRVWREVQDDNCTGQAAQLAYYLIFAVFPFLLFLTTLLGYLPIPNLMERMMAYMARLLPGETVTLLQDTIRQLVTNQKGGLLSFGILATLWSASSAVTAVTDALNRTYDVREGRPFWKVRGVAILLTIGFSVFIVSSMVLLIFGPQLGGWIAALIGLGTAFEVAWNILRWPVIVCLLTIAMACIYYFAPDVEQQWKWITPGAVFAVLVTLAVSLGFSFYVNNFGSYNKTYGSIGAVIVFLTWLYLSGFVMVVGGEINAEVEHAAPEGKAPGANDRRVSAGQQRRVKTRAARCNEEGPHTSCRGDSLCTGW
jgi:membrane protein